MVGRHVVSVLDTSTAAYTPGSWRRSDQSRGPGRCLKIFQNDQDNFLNFTFTLLRKPIVGSV